MAKVLYIDDEPDIREIAVMSLELRADFEVKSASSGAEALQIAQEWHPDLILLDVMMPGMDGPMTKSQLAAIPETASIPVVFITARTQPSEVERFLALGVAGVIAKPFDPMSLADEAAGFLS